MYFQKLFKNNFIFELFLICARIYWYPAKRLLDKIVQDLARLFAEYTLINMPLILMYNVPEGGGSLP